MFWKRKPKPASPPGEDPEIARLRARLARRQEEAAELEQELFDLRRFVAEVETHLLPLQHRLEQLRARLAEARGGRWRADHAAALDDAHSTPAPPPGPAPLDDADLKALYRALAKRFHPDLAADPAEKARRQTLMAQVNTAYGAHDIPALQALAALPEVTSEAGPQSRAQRLAALQAELERLDGVIAGLERELDELSRSPAVQLKLEVSLARHAGHNLLGQIAADLQAEITRLEAELASLRR